MASLVESALIISIAYISLSQCYNKFDLENINIDRLQLKINEISTAENRLVSKLNQTNARASSSTNFVFNVQPFAGYEDCSSLYKDGYKTNGVYAIWLPTSYRFLPIYCNMDLVPWNGNNHGWMIIQKRYNGKTNFQRSWAEYVNGFGDIAGEHWVGLTNIHELTFRAKHTKRMCIQVTDNLNFTNIMEYGNFYVTSAKHSFRLGSTYMIESEKPASDSLLRHSSLKFTTYDKNNQISRDNCATIYGGGWWHRPDCGKVNLNGFYPNATNPKGNIYWEGWSSSPIVEVSIMLQ